MTTNGAKTPEDAEMADCDGEKVVTMMDVLQEQQDFEEDANAVLGASDDKNCTYSKGYVKRQAIYACLTCCPEATTDPTKRAGVCLACSLACHENHELAELYTKRNFRCDCGNPKFSQPCQFTPNKTDLNYENKYNQNFSGIYCTCKRPYPDPEATEEEEMLQCIICEDWLHTHHLEATIPNNDQYAEMICKDCMEDIDFLHDYSDLVVNVEDKEIVVMDPDLDVTSAQAVKAKGEPKKEKLSNGSKEAEITENETISDNTESIVDSNKNVEISTDVEMSATKTDESGDGKDVTKEETIKSEQSEPKMDNVAAGDAVLDSTTEEPKEDQATNNDVEKEENVEAAKESNASENLNDKLEHSNDQADKTEHVKDQTDIVNDETGNVSDQTDKTQNVIDKTDETENLDSHTGKTGNDNDETVKADNDTTIKTGIENDHTDEAENNVIANEEMKNFNSDKNKTESTDKGESAEAESTTDTIDDKTVTTSEVVAEVEKSQQEVKDDANDDKGQDEIKDDIAASSDKENELPKKEHKRKLSEGDSDLSPKKQKLELEPCTRPKGVKRVYKGATFWPSNFRQKLCTCSECLSMYKDLAVLFLTDLDDTVTAYEALGKDNINGAPSSQYEKGLQALSSLDRIQQINALTEYNKMRDKLLDYLKSFKDRKEIVKEEDIKAFFAGMKPKREPDGVYFCR